MKGKPTGGRKTPQSNMADALKQLGRDQQKRKRQEARGLKKWGARWTQGWGGRIVTLAIVIIVLLLGDGVRREGREFKASVGQFTGKVTLVPADGSGERAVVANDAVKDGDQLRTGPRSTALLNFHDGSAITVEENTQFEIRLLDFARGGRRDRSFMVRSGSVLARVGTQFGLQSQATVCTPTTVAAVRGTAFRVAYDPAAKGSRLDVGEGTVDYRTPYGTQATKAGTSQPASGYNLGGPTTIGPDARRQMQTQVNSLAGQEEPFGGLLNAEWGLTNLFDPVLQLLGICPGGWGYNAMDGARRTACMEALRRLQQKVEEQTEHPQAVNPVTLEELNIDAKEQKRITTAFAGMMIDSYSYDGRNYHIRVRARDKAHTGYELTNTGITKTNMTTRMDPGLPTAPQGGQ